MVMFTRNRRDGVLSLVGLSAGSLLFGALFTGATGASIPGAPAALTDHGGAVRNSGDRTSQVRSAIVDGQVVSGRAWPDHPAWMHEFVDILRAKAPATMR